MTGKRWPLWVLVVAGTLVRLWFGVSRELWNSAPDQLAWGLALNDLAAGEGFSYKQLTHYPHEGGSVFIGLLSFLFLPLSGIMPPLSWVALFIDAFSRWIQVEVARKLFGDRTALWFGVWTVFAAPLMLPWATIDFGLHALMSFAPFLLVAVAADGTRPPFIIGVLCGVLASLAYDVWVFAPAWMLFTLFSGEALGPKFKNWVLFFLGSVLAFLPHFLIRSFMDHGFGLEDLSVLSVRGLEKDGMDAVTLPTKAWDVVTAALPGSFTLMRTDHWGTRLVSVVILSFIILGVIGALRIKDERSKARRLMTMTVLTFLLALITAPYFMPRADGNGYLYYRYFPFIAPLLVLLMLEGFAAWPRFASPLRGASYIVCVCASVLYMARTGPYERPNLEATGWVLGRKFGDEPERLLRMIDGAAPGWKDDLVYGAGWGITAALFDRRSTKDVDALAQFERIWSMIPSNEKKGMSAGVHRAFDPGITPVLDPELAPMVYERMRD